MLGITTTNARVGGFRGKGIDADATTIYNRIIADGGVSNLTRLNFFVKGLKTIYGSLANVPVCYDAHWIGYKLGSGTGATAGQAAAKLYSLTVAGDAVQATAASQPLLLAHNGASSDNYWYNPTSGNYCTTPNAASNQITGDIEMMVKLEFNNISAFQDFISKSDASNGYSFGITNTRFLNLLIGTTPSGSVSINSTVAITTPLSTLVYLKVTRVASSGVVTFFTSSDGITYTQLGASVTSTTGNIRLGSQALEVGQNASGTNNRFIGKIYRATIANTIGGTPVVDFNPATYNAATSQTAWTSSTGEVWTINTGTATTGYKGCLVSRTIVQGDGVDDTMQTTSAIWTSTSTVYSAINFINLDLKLGTSVDSDTTNSLILRFEGLDTVNNYFAYQGGIGISRNISARKNLLTLYNTVRNNTSSALNFNNVTDTTGTLNTVITTGVKILGNRSNTPSYFTNGNLNTILISGSADSGATRTATYNLIRSLNNNAF
jgi:hypothetical protein